MQYVCISSRRHSSELLFDLRDKALKDLVSYSTSTIVGIHLHWHSRVRTEASEFCAHGLDSSQSRISNIPIELDCNFETNKRKVFGPRNCSKRMDLKVEAEASHPPSS